MHTTPYTFTSDGLRLDAALYETTPDPTKPVVLANSGFTGLKHIHPERFARALTPLGYRVFAFDYRGFANSEGTKGEVLLEEQARDIANAATFLKRELDLAWNDLALLGWGMGGGLVLQASRMLPHVGGVIAMNGFYDSRRVQRALRGEAGLRDFHAWLERENDRRARGESVGLHDPFQIYPLDPDSRRYVDEVLRPTPGYEASVYLNFAQSLLAFDVEHALDHLEDTPALIVHGAENALHPPEEATSLARNYPGPVQLEWLDGVGHTEWMLDDHPIFQDAMRRVHAWLEATWTPAA